MAGQGSHLGPAAAFRVLQGLTQVQKTAALGHSGHPPGQSSYNGFPHGPVLGEPGSIQLRVSAGQIKAVRFRRKLCIIKGAEGHKGCPSLLQRFQGFRVSEAKGLIPGNSNPGNRRAVASSTLRAGNFSFRLAQRQQPLPVHRLQGALGQGLHPRLYIADLARGIKAQMPAFKNCLRHGRQVAQHRQPGFFFQHGGQAGIQRRAAVAEQDTCQMTVRPEIPQAPHLGRQGQAGALGPQHQQHRKPQRLGHMPGAGPVGAAQTVIQAHGPFAEGGIMPGCPRRIQAAQALFRSKEQIQIVTGHPQDRAVEHGIDIIRPALEGAGGEAPASEGSQQGAGHHGFAAAGLGRGQKKFNHCSSP